MARRGENWGQLCFDTTKGVHLDSTFSGSAGDSIVQIPLASIANFTATKADLILTLDSNAAGMTVAGVSLAQIRFAVPKTCVGFAQTEDASRDMLKKLQGLTGAPASGAAALATTTAGPAADLGTVIGELKELSVSQPAGIFTATFFTKGVRLTDPKRQLTINIPAAQVVKMFLAPVPNKESKYVVISLKTPIRIGSNTFTMVVLAFGDDKVIPEASPWELVITAAQITELFGADSALTPKMTGPLTEVICVALKEVLRNKMLSGGNSEYATGFNHQTCALSSTHKGTDGFLYVLKTAFLFLHRPATHVAYETVLRVEVDEASSGESFVLQVIIPKAGGGIGKAAEEKLTFSGIDKKEQRALMDFLRTKMPANRVLVYNSAHNLMRGGGPGPKRGGGDDDEDEDDDDDEDEEDDDEEDEDSEDSDFDGSEDSDERPRKKAKKDSAKKEKKDSGKKEKKDKSDKKAKKEAKKKEKKAKKEAKKMEKKAKKEANKMKEGSA